MKKSKIFLKIISIILSILLIIEILPMSVFAQELEKLESTTTDTEIEEATIIGEIESERTENTKHFRLSDGSFIAATYPEPVHYMVDGEWEEIDNTLVEKTIDGTDYYVNEKASNKVAFSQVLSDESVIIQDADGYEISLTPINDKANKSKGKKKDVEDLTSSKLMKEQAKADKKAEKMEAKNKKSGVKYSDVYNDTDIEYIVTPSTVKENIIVNKKTGKYVYDFNADFGNLVPKFETESVIGLYDTSKKATEPVILVEAPVMYDAAGETSTDVSISFKQNGDKYIVTVTASKEWINDKSREFPVVIDPTVKLDVSRADISDIYVDTADPTYSHMYSDYLYVGKNRLGTTRTYIKYNLPDLPDCSIVIGAALVLQQYEHDPGNGATNYIYAYDCGTNSWSSETINWNNQPMSKTDLSQYTVLDYQKYVNNTTSGSTITAAQYVFNITKAAKNWYEQGINNGIMLASANESVTKKSCFCSSEYSTNSDFFPSVWVTYVNNTGVEDYWTYKTADLGRSGAAYVSDYNGSFTYVHNDVATSGNRMPASVSHVYSNERTNFSGTYGNMYLGVGFRLDIMEKVETIASSTALYTAGYRLKFIDGDGTVHYFKKTDTSNQYKHEFNDKLIIKKLSDGKYEMSDEKDNKKIFNLSGWLVEIADSNSNKVTITYNNNRITKVTDGAGKEITFEYDGNYLVRIKDPANRVTSFTYYVGSDANQTKYLKTIQYPDGKITTLNYNTSTTMMSQVICHDTSSLLMDLKKISCKTTSFYRIAKLTRNGQADSEGRRSHENVLTFTYNNGETVVTDLFGKSNYIYFDNAGRTVNVRDHESNTSYSKYNSSGNKTNTLAQQSNTFAPINNLAKNNSAEFTDNGEWYQQIAGAGAGSATITTEEAYVGYKSFKVTNTTTSGGVNYCQALTITPGVEYTLSAYIKIPTALEGSSNSGVCLAYSFADANGVWSTVYGELTRDATDWRRISYTFALPSDATGSIGIKLQIKHTSGTVYFDGVQFEKNSTMNRYNLLDNSGFDYNNLNWNYSNNTTSDGVVTSGLNGKSVRLYGAPPTNKNIYQHVQINGKSGVTVVFGAFAKANAAGQTHKNDSGAYIALFEIRLRIFYKDGTSKIVKEPFCEDVSNAQYICAAYTLEKECNYVTVELNYFDNVNSVIFDDACLYLDNYGSNYEYDEDGKLVAVEDGTGQGITYTYDGPDLTKISQKFDGEEKESCEYTYDDNHNLLTETTKGGVITEYSYTHPSGSASDSTYGNPTKVTVKNSDGSLQSSCTMTYTSDFNYLVSVKDSRDGTTTYNYDTVKGLLNSVTDANGNTTTYTYDPNTDALLSTSGQTSSTANPLTNSYTYANDRLTSITHNGFSYGFNYDSFGRVTSTTVAGQTLISHTYNANGTLNKSTYGNGDYVNYSYDALDRVVANSYNGVKTFEYDYNKEGLVTKETDYENNVVKNYEYDFARRLVGETSSNGLRSNYTYDERNNIKNLYVTKGDEILANNVYTYKEDGLVDTVTMPLFGDTVQTNHYDSLNRLKKESILVPSPYIDPIDIVFDVDYTYVNEPSEDSEGENTPAANQTGLIERIKYGSTWVDTSTGQADYGFDKQLAYTYDANGNIKTVSKIELDENKKEFATLLHTYTYDGLNQLIRHDDFEVKKSYEFIYDNGGNLLYKKEYAYTTGTLGTPTATVPYSYSSTWKDQLSNYNGKGITYDEIGNVVSYDGYTYEWEKGRQLSSITGNGLDMSFEYNSSGLRTKKVVGNKTIEYYYSGDLLIAQYDGQYWIKFIYSASGEAIGFVHNGFDSTGHGYYNTSYYYVKNAQGDILGFYNEFVNIYREYSYDAWGSITGVYDEYGAPVTDPDDIAYLNPLRYRSYYYDDETGLYYLNSRYYNPEWGRFISGDAITAVNSDLLSTNIYAYCFNNSVNLEDQTGYYTGVDDFTAFVVGVVSGIGGQLLSDALTGSRSPLEDYIGSAIGSGLGGVVSLYCPPAGAAVSSGLSVYLGESFKCITGKSDKTIDYILLESVLNAGVGVFVDEFSSALVICNNTSSYSKIKSAYNKNIAKLGQKNTKKDLSYIYKTIDYGMAAGMVESIAFVLADEVVPKTWNKVLYPLISSLCAI